MLGHDVHQEVADHEHVGIERGGGGRGPLQGAHRLGRGHGDAGGERGVAEDDLDVGPQGLPAGGGVDVGQEERRDLLAADAGGVGGRQALEQHPVVQHGIDLAIRREGVGHEERAPVGAQAAGGPP